MNTNAHDRTVDINRQSDLKLKQQAAVTSYRTRKESTYKQKYEKDQYLAEVQHDNVMVRNATELSKIQHEQKLNRLS